MITIRWSADTALTHYTRTQRNPLRLTGKSAADDVSDVVTKAEQVRQGVVIRLHVCMHLECVQLLLCSGRQRRATESGHNGPDLISVGVFAKLFEGRL